MKLMLFFLFWEHKSLYIFLSLNIRNKSLKMSVLSCGFSFLRTCVYQWWNYSTSGYRKISVTDSHSVTFLELICLKFEISSFLAWFVFFSKWNAYLFWERHNTNPDLYWLFGNLIHGRYSAEYFLDMKLIYSS